MIVDCKRTIFFRKRIFQKNSSDISHSFDRDLVIIKVLYLWSLRWSWRLNAFPQISQGNGLSSVCVRSWINKLYDLEKWRPQNLQMYSFFCLKKYISISIHRYKTKKRMNIVFSSYSATLRNDKVDKCFRCHVFIWLATVYTYLTFYVACLFVRNCCHILEYVEGI